MKKGCIFFDEIYIDEIDYNKDFFLLKENMKKNGVNFDIQTVNTPEQSDFIIYYNMPTFKIPYPEKSYVIIAEPPVIFSRNFHKNKYKNFKKVFTWQDDIIDGKKIIQLPYPQIFGTVDFNLTKKKKLCTLIARNKHSRRKNELFSERYKAVKWFENNHPEDFDLWGNGWAQGVIAHFSFLDIKKPTPKVFKGIIPKGKKTEILNEYKFSICYENWLNNCGYITEKIFDCFSASNVPIYLGAQNITKYIPKNCFIDKKHFKTYDELYKFIKNMPDDEYLNYLKNIENFLSSDEAKFFSHDNWSEIIMKEILQ